MNTGRHRATDIAIIAGICNQRQAKAVTDRKRPTKAARENEEAQAGIGETGMGTTPLPFTPPTTTPVIRRGGQKGSGMRWQRHAKVGIGTQKRAEARCREMQHAEGGKEGGKRRVREGGERSYRQALCANADTAQSQQFEGGDRKRKAQADIRR